MANVEVHFNIFLRWDNSICHWISRYKMVATSDHQPLLRKFPRYKSSCFITCDCGCWNSLAGTSTQCHRNECDRCLKIGARPPKHMISFQCNKWLLLSTALSNWEICCTFFIDMQNIDRKPHIFPIDRVFPVEIPIVTYNWTQHRK